MAMYNSLANSASAESFGQVAEGGPGGVMQPFPASAMGEYSAAGEPSHRGGAAAAAGAISGGGGGGGRGSAVSNADLMERTRDVQLRSGEVVTVAERCWRKGLKDFGTMFAEWKFSFDGVQHELALKHAMFSGKRKVRLDGRVVLRKFKFLDNGSIHTWMCAGHQLKLAIRLAEGVHFSYQLFIDGQEVDRHGDLLLTRSGTALQQKRRREDRDRTQARAARLAQRV